MKTLLLITAILLCITLESGAEQYALTIDDPHCESYPGYNSERWNAMLLETLARHHHQATLFVCGKRIDSTQGAALLKTWDRSGHTLANHTYRHFNYNSGKRDVSDLKKDIKQTEKLLSPYANNRKLFRFPYLKAGETQEKRDGARDFFRCSGYRHGYVSIDASDWAINTRLLKALERDPKADLSKYRDFYLEHMLARAQFYSKLAKRVEGREVRHTLLLHHSLLNALFLDDLIVHFERHGWNLVDSDLAFEDPIYSTEPDVLPAGESIIWSRAREKGISDLRYPAEDGSYEKARMDDLGL